MQDFCLVKGTASQEPAPDFPKQARQLHEQWSQFSECCRRWFGTGHGRCGVDVRKEPQTPSMTRRLERRPAPYHAEGVSASEGGIVMVGSSFDSSQKGSPTRAGKDCDHAKPDTYISGVLCMFTPCHRWKPHKGGFSSLCLEALGSPF